MRLAITEDAWRRCFDTITLLAQRYDRPVCEFGMLGLSAPDIDPLLVLATPLLVGQEVNIRSVRQAGRNVLRTRREIESLSEQCGYRLLPVAWLHRHPGSCEKSRIDDAFLRTVFAEEVSTVLTFREAADPARVEPLCACDDNAPDREYGLCFGVIFNARREHHLYAVRTDFCNSCGAQQTAYVPAALQVVSSLQGPAPLPPAMALETEIAEKIRFVDDVQPVGGQR